MKRVPFSAPLFCIWTLSDEAGLFDRLCACLFLKLLDIAFEPALFLGVLRLGKASVESLDVGQVNTADGRFDFFLYRYDVENLLIAYERHDLRTNLCLDDGKLGAAHELRRAVDDHLRQAGFLYPHLLFVDNKHCHCLLIGLDLLFLFRLLLLHLVAQKIKDGKDGDENDKDHDQCDNPGFHGAVPPLIPIKIAAFQIKS